MQMVGPSSEEEMVAVFLLGELSSQRFGMAVATALAKLGHTERLLTDADITDDSENEARRAVLAATRGYGADRDVFEDYPAGVRWWWAILTGQELARVRYIEYSFWNELSGGTRLPGDAARQIRAGSRAFDVPNDRFEQAAAALAGGTRFPPLILVGESPDDLVCLEGHVRLTAHALTGFAEDVRCLVGTAPGMACLMR